MKPKLKWVIFAALILGLIGLFLYYEPELPDVQERFNSFSEHKAVDKYDTKQGTTYERLKEDSGQTSKTQQAFNRLDIKDRVEQTNDLIKRNWCANSCKVLNLTLKSYKTTCNCK